MKTRLDSLIVSRGLVRSRERAKALIMEGKVLVDGLPAAKAGTMVSDNAGITIKEDMISLRKDEKGNPIEFVGIDFTLSREEWIKSQISKTG